MKTTNPLASLLRRSPFKPIQEHMRTVKLCADEVPGLFEALLGGDDQALNAAKERIFTREQEADDIRNSLREHLPKSLFTPVDRRDLLDLMEMQDCIANVAQDIAGLLVERRMEVLEPMRDPLMELVKHCVATVAHLTKIAEQLDELVETGFGGNEADRVEEMIVELNRKEDETDRLGIALSKTLFDNEDQLKPLTVVFWYRLIEWIGDLADYAEKAGDRMRLLIAR
jgi:predicted phosphate transport protein (TIGR00153 family)